MNDIVDVILDNLTALCSASVGVLAFTDTKRLGSSSLSIRFTSWISVRYFADTMDDAATPRNAPAGPHYRNNLELEEALRNFTQRCSHISKLYSY